MPGITGVVNTDQNHSSDEGAPLKCALCGDPTPEVVLDADDRCPLCAAIDNLRVTMERKGTRHPELFDRPIKPTTAPRPAAPPPARPISKPADTGGDDSDYLPEIARGQSQLPPSDRD